MARPGFTVQQALWGGALVIVLGLTAAWRLAAWRANADEGDVRALIRQFAVRTELWNEKTGQYPASPVALPDMQWPAPIDPFFYRADPTAWVLVVRHPTAGRLCASVAPVEGGDRPQATCGDDLTATVGVSATTLAPGAVLTLDAASALRTLGRADTAPVTLIAWKVGAAPWDVGPARTHRVRQYTLPDAKTRYPVELLALTVRGTAVHGLRMVRTTAAPP